VIKFIHQPVGKIMSRNKFTPEFKIESASLVLDQGYSIPEACAALGCAIGAGASRRNTQRQQSVNPGSTKDPGAGSQNYKNDEGE
jgi:transposase-like protein